MRKLILAVLILAFTLTFSACRDKTKKKVIQEKSVEKTEKTDDKGVLERAGEEVDEKVNKEVDDEIDKINDDN